MKLPEKIVFATNNAHKLKEVRDILGSRCEILSLSDIGCHDDIPETAPTLEGNALIKARWVKEKYGFDCFADDTGLEVNALGGEPGVKSARYAASYGESADHDSKANMKLLLKNLDGRNDRTARFRTVIALLIGDEEKCFAGKVEGCITETPSGTDGFGYDPVFRPEGCELTFAQMGAEQKNSLSHRRRALDAMTAAFTDI
ncbi:RdgB/HAM1 family non-canonical purine NTP pyrophosphatase [uncultured Duncaniella sp.]|jgi:XTP/dITP diphosphohydrolase|uniref:RdgB/HAM1 family non-canonical purine NTP pyrophosphatase n=1 Tax=uncultured Duncaniella sp. TaxID=2768039 RepID=UPI000A8408BE|nr:RdgB/HAM1 family non-canonical purine NTP pyrophosphatase [uncultured Duncaniella sp.]MBJ2195249.1 RdgB/HAM1 family non-canonical purine NTP pyrophosphatase [Muribaculaceae bacterium]